MSKLNLKFHSQVLGLAHDGKVTIAKVAIYDSENKVLSVATAHAICNPNDNADEDLGARIAILRAKNKALKPLAKNLKELYDNVADMLDEIADSHLAICDIITNNEDRLAEITGKAEQPKSINPIPADSDEQDE
jgi:adenosyl cobinamide kinase/adenosyl cobinamide phosphate guanylyltransferase